MKIRAFKISQESQKWKHFQIFMTKMNIFDLKDYVYVKRIDEDYKKLKESTAWIKIFSEMSWTDWSEVSNNRLREVQRKLKNSKIKWITKYIEDDLWIFPSSVLLWVKEDDNFLQVKNNGNDIYDITFSKWKGFFIIDWQHRIFWILKYIEEKIEENFNVSVDSKYEISRRIELLLKKIWEKAAKNFINENVFELPLVIMYEIKVATMVELFADINVSASKLEPDFSTYIYWVWTNKDIERKIFVIIWEKLNNDKMSPLYDRIKLPYSITDKKYSKISINPFYTNSSKMLTLSDRIQKDKYFFNPFNLLLDNFIKDSEFTDYKSPETLSFLINGLIIIYHWTYTKIKEVYWDNRYNNEEYKFISSSNHFMYLYIIKIITIKLYLQSKNDDIFIEFFSNSTILDSINNIFDEEIKENLEKVYEDYEYFREWSLKWTGWITWTNIENQFKIHYYWINIEEWKLMKDLLKEEENQYKSLIKEEENKLKEILNKRLK